MGLAAFNRMRSRAKPDSPTPEPTPTPELSAVPTRSLAERLAEVGDAAVIRAAMDADTRTSARALYERRLAEIEGNGGGD